MTSHALSGIPVGRVSSSLEMTSLTKQKEEELAVLRTQQPRKKRNKVALACEECRERKVRCDGVQPVCGTCTRRYHGQKLCNYGNDIPKAAVDRHYIRTLHDRIRHLENICQVRRSHMTSQQELEPSGSDQRAYFPRWDAESRHTTDEPMQVSVPLVQEGRAAPDVVAEAAAGRPANLDFLTTKRAAETQDGHENPVNAMGTGYIGCRRVVTDNEGYFGKSSAASFFNQVREVFSRYTGKNPGQFCPRSLRSQPRKEGPSVCLAFDAESAGDYSLPPRAIADKLLDLYHRRVYGLYPFIHWETLMNGYKRLWTAEPAPYDDSHAIGLGAPDCPQPVFYSALNMMFALGLQFSDDPFEQREAMSKLFFRRSNRLCHIDILDRGSLAIVQALLIMAQYLQSTNLPNRCWNVVGLACRIAQGLGMHLPEGDEMRSELVLEIRRRTWHECVLLDTVLSTTLGRPATISYQYTVPLPRPIDDECLTQQGADAAQLSRGFAKSSFFIQALKLNAILSDVLSKAYNPIDTAQERTDDLDERAWSQLTQTIIDIDVKLAKFERELPAPFRWSEVPPDALEPENLVQLQRNVLGERFFLIRVLLYRPVLIRLCDMELASIGSSRTPTRGMEPGLDFISRFQRQCSAACIESARSLICLVNVTASALSTGAGAWWYNLYYTFTSAMVLVLCDLCPSIWDMLDREGLDRAWQECQDILALMKRSTTALESFKVLQKMRTSIRADQSGMNAADINRSSAAGPIGRGNQESVNLNPSSLSSEPTADLNDGVDLGFEEAGWTNMLWEDFWTFASGQPLTWDGE